MTNQNETCQSKSLFMLELEVTMDKSGKTIKCDIKGEKIV